MLSLCAVRRTQLASDDLFKSACAQVKNVRGVKKVKNISEDAFGTKLGRIHVPAQEISKIQVHTIGCRPPPLPIHEGRQVEII
jgi:hypothetical protein